MGYPRGRLAFIAAGEYVGRYLYIYPETVEPWWTGYVSPSLDPREPIELLLNGVAVLDNLQDEWKLEWIERDDLESKLEREHFGIRPLKGPPSWLR